MVKKIELPEDPDLNMWKSFWESKFRHGPIGVILLSIIGWFASMFDEAAFSSVLSRGSGFWFLLGWFLCACYSDLRERKSFIKKLWHRIWVGIIYKIDVVRADNQEGVRDGYVRAYLVQEIQNCRTNRCFDKFNTKLVVKHKSLRWELSGESIADTEKTYKAKMTSGCIDGVDQEEINLLEFLVPKNVNKPILYRIPDSEEFGDDYVEATGDNAVTLKISCASEKTRVGTSDLIVAFNSSPEDQIFLIGGAGEYICQSCSPQTTIPELNKVSRMRRAIKRFNAESEP